MASRGNHSAAGSASSYPSCLKSHNPTAAGDRRMGTAGWSWFLLECSYANESFSMRSPQNVWAGVLWNRTAREHGCPQVPGSGDYGDSSMLTKA